MPPAKLWRFMVALKAFAYRGAGDIDDLAGLEHIDFEFAARQQARRLRPWPAGIPERYNRRRHAFGKMAGQGLGDARRAAAANGDLNRAIAVGLSF